jgi:hypothetical protein
MSCIEIGDPNEIKSAAKNFADAAAVPAGEATQVAQQLVLSDGPVRSRLDDSMAGALDWIGAVLDAAARSRVGRADAIGGAAADVVDAVVAADEAGAEQLRRAMPT